jgi:hypothetical protein
VSVLLAAVFIVALPMHPAAGLVVVTVATAFLIIEHLRDAPSVNGVLPFTLMLAMIAAGAFAVRGLADGSEMSHLIRILVVPSLAFFVFANHRISSFSGHVYLDLMIGLALLLSYAMLFERDPGQYDVSIERLLTLDRDAGFFLFGSERLGPNAVSVLAAFGAAVALARLKFAVGLPLMAVMAIGPLAAAVLVAGGRSAMIGLLFLALLFMVSPDASGRRLGLGPLVASVALLLFLGLGGAWLGRALAARHGDAMELRLVALANPAEDHNVQVRLRLWISAVAMVRERPAGSGFSAFFDRHGKSPHNELLGQAVTIGVVGASLGTFIFIFVGWQLTLGRLSAVRRRRESVIAANSEWRFAALAVAAVLSLASVTENISRAGMSTYYPLAWAVFGMAFQRSGKPSRQIRVVRHGLED